MARLRASFLSRSGILSYLRRLRAGGVLPGDDLSAVVAREVASATKTLRAELRDLREEMRLRHAVLVANSSPHAARHEAAMDASGVGQHVRAAIASAPLALDPTPHLVANKLLPDATCAALLDAIPPDECVSKRGPLKQNFRPAHAAPSPISPNRCGPSWSVMSLHASWHS